VDQLERVFRKMQLRLVSLEAALLSSIRILGELREIRGKTCLVQVIDGRETTGLIFVKGVYRASMRNHLWEPFGTIGFGVEFARLNGQMLQNMQKEFPDNPPEGIYLGGLREDNLTVVSEAIMHLGTSLPLGTPDGSAYVYADHQTAESPSCFSEYLAPISALRYPDEARDFLISRRSGIGKRMPMRFRVMIAAASLLFLILGAAVIAFGANLLVDNGIIIANTLGVPETVITLTFVALGTSLPELVTAITSLVKGHSSLSLGNIIGANIFNLVLVSGTAITIAPFDVPAEKTIAGLNASLVVDIPVVFIVRKLHLV
jgi:hypothetical protein